MGDNDDDDRMKTDDGAIIDDDKSNEKSPSNEGLDRRGPPNGAIVPDLPEPEPSNDELAIRRPQSLLQALVASGF